VSFCQNRVDVIMKPNEISTQSSFALSFKMTLKRVMPLIPVIAIFLLAAAILLACLAKEKIEEEREIREKLEEISGKREGGDKGVSEEEIDKLRSQEKTKESEKYQMIAGASICSFFAFLRLHPKKTKANTSCESEEEKTNLEVPQAGLETLQEMTNLRQRALNCEDAMNEKQQVIKNTNLKIQKLEEKIYIIDQEVVSLEKSKDDVESELSNLEHQLNDLDEKADSILDKSHRGGAPAPFSLLVITLKRTWANRSIQKKEGELNKLQQLKKFLFDEKEKAKEKKEFCKMIINTLDGHRSKYAAMLLTQRATSSCGKSSLKESI